VADKKKKLLITGGSGLLALNWACAVRKGWDVILGLHHRKAELLGARSQFLNLDESKKSISQIRDLAPNLIVHTAGWTSVEKCEAHPEVAMQINARLAGSVAKIAATLKVPHIHISTDHLFQGNESFYTENSVPSPLNCYGKSKQKAEDFVQTYNSDSLIIRTNFFGWGHLGRKSISDQIIQSLRQGDTINMFTDVFFSPILADHLVTIAHNLIEIGYKGIVNVPGCERVSKYEFACRIAKKFYLPDQNVQRASITERKNLTSRPKDMSLSSKKIQELLGFDLAGLDEQFERLRDQEAQGRHAELLNATKDPCFPEPELFNKKTISYGQHRLSEADIDAVVEVLRSSTITQGTKVSEFGNNLADFSGAKFSWPVSNGTAALHLSLIALGIGPGDEVITTPLTFCATANAILYTGANVRFVDVDPNTLNIDVNLIERAITPKTKAILPVDFRGHPADLREIKLIADRYGIKVVEDGAHSIGSTYKYKGETYKCGDCQHVDLCTYSFHPVKHITTGEGGAVTTNDSDLFQRIQNLCKHGIDRRDHMFSDKERRGSWYYEMDSLGFNYRLTDFQAALGSSQLKKLPEIKRRRREIVKYYNQELSQYEELQVPFESPSVDSNFHLYLLRVRPGMKADRYDLFTGLQRLNYRPMVHYIPIHLLGYYKRNFGYKQGDFPVAEKCYQESLSIPLYPSLSDEEVDKCIKDIAAIIRRK
tara:strand:+ start:7745 stop:9874 length:2130 start_codon:yes stop_codon:yes gene_type:complete